MNEIIYFDNAATTPIRPEVYDAIRPYIESCYGNPSSVYKLARGKQKSRRPCQKAGSRRH